MTPQEITELSTKIGLVPSIVIVVLYIVFTLGKLLIDKRAENKKIELENKKEEARQKSDAEAKEKIFDRAVNAFKPVHTVKEQEQDRIRNEYINAQLNCLTEEGAQRAYLFSMHNGNNDILGRGYLKMSITNESIRPGYATIMAKYQNMPRTLFPVIYSNITTNENGAYNIKDIEDIKVSDPYTYTYLQEHGSKSALFRAIKRPDGLIIGMVCMEFVEPCDFIEQASRNIDKKTDRISGSLLGTGVKHGN